MFNLLSLTIHNFYTVVKYLMENNFDTLRAKAAEILRTELI
jgi:hypothetical protein